MPGIKRSASNGLRESTLREGNRAILRSDEERKDVCRSIHKEAWEIPPVCIPRSWEMTWPLSRYSDCIEACKLSSIFVTRCHRYVQYKHGQQRILHEPLNGRSLEKSCNHDRSCQ